MGTPDPHADPLLELERLRREVDAETARLARVHRERLQCRRGCSGCCVDDLRVFEIEAESIRRHHAELLAREAPHPPGACAFLDAEGACRIYANRPYVCRTQGLPLRWIQEDEGDGGTRELRDICPLDESGPALEGLPAEECWPLGPTEARLAEIQSRAGGGQGRVRLRDLFEKGAR